MPSKDWVKCRVCDRDFHPPDRLRCDRCLLQSLWSCREGGLYPAGGAMIRFFVAGIPKSMSVGTTIKFRRSPEGPLQHVQSRRHTEWAILVWEIGLKAAPAVPLEGPLAFSAIFYLPRPKSARKAEGFPIRRPDVDALVHKLSDAFNGVFWHDDSQLVDFSVRKRYATDRVGVEIRVEPVS